MKDGGMVVALVALAATVAAVLVFLSGGPRAAQADYDQGRLRIVSVQHGIGLCAHRVLHDDMGKVTCYQSHCDGPTVSISCVRDEPEAPAPAASRGSP